MQCLCSNEMEPWGSGFGSRDSETRIWRCTICGRLRLCTRQDTGHITERFYRREDPPDTCSRRQCNPIDLDLHLSVGEPAMDYVTVGTVFAMIHDAVGPQLEDLVIVDYYPEVPGGAPAVYAILATPKGGQSTNITDPDDGRRFIERMQQGTRRLKRQ